MAGRKVFLDVGAHVGETLQAVLEPKYGFDRIYCFEPVSACREALNAFEDGRVTVCAFGLSDRTGTMRIFNPGSLGGSVFADKEFSAQFEECDFVRAGDWFRENIRAEDEVYVKLNCEGSECDVIDDLLRAGELPKVTAMAVYWDCRKIPSQAHREHEVKGRMAQAGFSRFLDAKLVMTGGDDTTRTQRWLNAVGADTDRDVVRKLRRLQYVVLPSYTRRLRFYSRRVLPAPVFRPAQQMWRAVRYARRS